MLINRNCNSTRYVVRRTYCIINNNKIIIIFFGDAPDINVSVINALTAADDVLIPVEVDDNTLEGMNELLDQIDDVKEELNPDLENVRCFVTKYQKFNQAHLQGAEIIEEQYPIMRTKIRFSGVVARSTFVRIIQEDKNMTIFMLSNLYGSARVRNGHLNYQGSTAGITFNPGGVFEHELSWQSLAKNLIGKYGHKRPVKMATINAPEPAITLTESEAVKAFCEAYPEKLKTIMRICRRCKDNGEAAKAVQLEFAPCGFSAVGGYKVNYRFKSFSAGLEIEVNNEKVSMKYGRLIVEAKNLYDPLSPEFDVELKKPETKEDEGPVKCITGQSGSGLCGAAAYCDKKYTCCSQCPDDCNFESMKASLARSRP